MSIDETAMLLSGQLVRNENGTFYFNQPGNWTDGRGWPDHNRLHRTDGPAAIYASGTRLWYVNGQRHRTDGPAAIWGDGYQEWWIGNQLQPRGDPAVRWVDGESVK